MSKRKRIPQENKVRAYLQKEINSICPFCNDEEVGHFQIHHIDDDPSNNDINNLLLLCPTCHSKITKGDITKDVVIKRKQELKMNDNIHKPAQIFYINSNMAPTVLGNNNKVTIKTVKKTKPDKYPIGCIGYEIIKANYISYLITRFHDCKKYEVGKPNMNYAIFSSHLKKTFKIGKTRTIYHVPISRFEELAEYIQLRIAGTKLGKILKEKNQRIYSTYGEYVDEQGKESI